MSSAAAEQKVKKLARLPGNTVCANCGTDKKFGFSTVCIKYFTFVCSDCKASHQAISHRCKSLTMSSWTDAEVAELAAKGNDYCRRTWLKNAPPVGTGGRPKEGDHVDVFKRFVVDVYERRRYYGEDTAPPVAQTASQQVATAIPLPDAPQAPARRSAPRVMPPVAAPAPIPRAPAPVAVSDLLDFSVASHAPAPSSSVNDFAAFASPVAPAPPSSSGSAFGFIAAPPAAPSPTPAHTSLASSSFAFISKPPEAAPAPTPSMPSNDFADFAGLSISAPSPAPMPTQPAVKKPVMSLASNQKGSLISSMDSMSGQSQPGMGFSNGGGMMPQQQGGFNNMGMMGMNNHMNTGNLTPAQKRQQLMMQQRMMMQQQGISMNGMNINSNMGMMGNPGMMGNAVMMGNSGMMNNSGMMGNSNMMGGSGGMNNGMGIGMMSPQQMMNFGGSGSGGQPSGNHMNNTSAMNSFSMSGMDMNAWTTGKK